MSNGCEVDGDGRKMQGGGPESVHDVHTVHKTGIA